MFYVRMYVMWVSACSKLDKNMPLTKLPKELAQTPL